VLEELAVLKTELGFKGYEVVKSIAFESETNELGQGFSVENGLLTPTFKFKRPQMTKKYKATLDELYGKAAN